MCVRRARRQRPLPAARQVVGQRNLANGYRRTEGTARGRRLGKFQDMLRDLDHKHFLESRYNLLSQQVHVTHGAVTGFIDARQSELGITYEQNSPYRSVATHVAALAATLARRLLARLRNDEAMLRQLPSVSDRLQLPIDLSDQLPPAKKRVGI